MNNNVNFEGALSWDSPIEKESNFVLLPPGEYPFTVKKMERATYQPSPNSSIRDVSPKADLEILVRGNGEETTVLENLILHSKMEWKLSQFFIAIGQKKSGEPLNPNWGMVPGATGMCKVIIDKYTTKNGAEREVNRIDEFLQPTAQTQPTYQQPNVPVQQPATTQNANPGFSF